MGDEHDDRVGRRHSLRVHDIDVARRSVGDPLACLGECLIPHGHRSAARHAGEHDLGVAKSSLRIQDRFAEVAGDTLHDECCVDAAVAGVRPQDVMARGGQAANDGKVHAATYRVHEHDQCVRFRPDGFDQVAVQTDQCPAAGIDLARDLRVVGEADHIRHPDAVRWGSRY